MKQKIVLLLGVFLLFTLFIGCRADVAQRQAGTVQGSSYVVQDQNLTPPGTLPIVRQPITLSIGMGVSIWIADYYDNDLTRYLQDLTGVNLEFVLYDAGADGTTRLNLQVAAGEPLPDLIFGLGIGEAARRMAYGRAGAILPLNDYIEHMGVHTQYAVSRVQEVLGGVDPWFFGMDDDGYIWGYLGYSAVFPNQSSGRAWYNKDFADVLGMNESQWRGGDLARGRIADQAWFVNYLRGVRDNDVNRNGIPNDEIPLLGHTAWRGQVLNWLTRQYIYSDYSSTNNYWMIDDRGQLDVVYDKPQFQEALRFINMLYNERLWDEMSLTRDTIDPIVNQQDPMVGVIVSGTSFVTYPRLVTYLPIGVVEGPNGYAANTYSVANPGFNWAISANSQYPEAAFRFLDATSSDADFPILPRYGMKDRDWRIALPGEVGLYGDIGPTPVYFTELINTWGYNNTAHWRAEFGIDYMNRKSAMAWNGDEDNDEWHLGIAVQAQFPYTPARVPVGLRYTSDQLEQWADQRITIRNYVNQSLALFGTGQMNPDTDFAGFVDTLRRMGYLDLLAMDRQAYAALMAGR